MNINFDLEAAGFKDVLHKVRLYASRPRKAITAALFALDRKVRDTFQEQKDPWGYPWPDLKEATLKRRKKNNINSKAKLIATTRMFRSLDRKVDSNNRGRIWIGEDDRPVTPHQFGSLKNNLPARPMMPMKMPGVISMPDDWNDEINKHLIESLEDHLK